MVLHISLPRLLWSAEIWSIKIERDNFPSLFFFIIQKDSISISIFTSRVSCMIRRHILSWQLSSSVSAVQ